MTSLASPPHIESDPRPRWVLPVALVLLSVVIVFLAISIPGHRIHLDEAWVGEQAYFLARDGYVHSNLFDGFAGNGERIVLYHYLFVRAGAEIINLFGWGLAQLRIVPIVCSVLLLAMMASYLRLMRSESWSVVVLALTVFLLIPVNFEFFKVYRPETMAALFGFGSFALLESFVQRNRLGLATAAGAAAAASALAHPYGAVFGITGIIALIMAKRGWGILLFCAAATIVVLPSALDILNHRTLFQSQIANPLVAEKTQFTLLSPLYNLSREHMRLFRNVGTIPITSLFIIATFLLWRQREPRERFLLMYAVVLIVVVGALVQDKIDRYAMLLFPWFAMVVARFLDRLLCGEIVPPWTKVVAGGACLALLGYGLGFQARTAFADRMDVAGMNRLMAEHLSSGETVIGPMNLIFNEIEHYDIAATKLAAIRGGGTPTAQGIAGLAYERGARYLVFNRYQAIEEGLRDTTEARQLGRWFHRVAESDSFEVWKLTGDGVP